MSRVAITELIFRGTENLRPASGAQVYVYQRGAGLATLYTAESGGSIITQPLVTDSSGRPVDRLSRVESWVEPGSYTLKVNGMEVPFEAAKGGAGGEGEDVLLPVINVKGATYGAKGDGSTDDAAAINAAITAANAAGGGDVFLPEGTYVVGASLLIKEHVRLVGAGRDASIIKAKASTSVNVIRTANYEANGGTPRWSIEGLSIDGNRGNGATGRGIDVDGYIFVIRDVLIHDTSGIGLKSQKTHTETVGQQEMGFIENIRLESCEGGLLSISGPVDSILTNVVGWRNGTGFGFKVSTGCKWIHCHPCGNSEYNWEITGANNTFVDCYAEGAKKAYVRLLGSSTGNRFFGGRYFFGGGEDGALCFLFEGGETGGTEILDGQWQNCTVAKFAGPAYNSKVQGSAYTVGSRLAFSELGTADGTVKLEVDLQGAYTAVPVKELGSTNNFAIPKGSNFAKVTGTEQIKKIAVTYPGHQATLLLASTASLISGENLKLKGNFTGAEGRMMTLICDGTYWWEVSRNEITSPIGAESVTEEKLASAVKSRLRGPTRTYHTWTFNGPVEAINYGGFYVSANTEETVKLIGMKYKIGEGTSCKIRVLKNGAELASYKEKEVTTTAAEVSSEVALATGDRLELVVESTSGTPKNPIITVFLEHTH